MAGPSSDWSFTLGSAALLLPSAVGSLFTNFSAFFLFIQFLPLGMYTEHRSAEIGVLAVTESNLGEYFICVRKENVLVNEILHGADGTSIKCGVIGEIGCSWPLTDSERKVLQATAHAQAQLGCPVIIHPGRNPGAPFQIIRILQEAGADISKTVMSHLDRSIFNKKELLEFAELGCYLEYDLFGTELLNYQLSPDIDMPDDNKRIKRVRFLVDEGYEDRILMAHDIHTKHRLMKYGGHGYSHILTNIVPKMLLRGVAERAVDKILIENPRRWLTFK
ncbi:Phosphotriesterase-related protein [Microtus ochrogaster]|uniref:N-acetyltaurine hydrolase n=1 Tax=Microtus ochrogaster TaxID=79684 RepID=A0A8J6KLJ1_MICOH|nr:Phosphotriesterase-related protein [Microtus ochrogaster]